MQVEFIVNGGVSLIFSPENEAEEALLKQMMKQDNELIEIRSSVTILSKTLRSGVLIAKKGSKSSKDNEDQKEDLQ